MYYYIPIRFSLESYRKLMMRSSKSHKIDCLTRRRSLVSWDAYETPTSRLPLEFSLCFQKLVIFASHDRVCHKSSHEVLPMRRLMRRISHGSLMRQSFWKSFISLSWDSLSWDCTASWDSHWDSHETWSCAITSNTFISHESRMRPSWDLYGTSHKTAMKLNFSSWESHETVMRVLIRTLMRPSKDVPPSPSWLNLVSWATHETLMRRLRISNFNQVEIRRSLISNVGQ